MATKEPQVSGSDQARVEPAITEVTTVPLICLRATCVTSPQHADVVDDAIVISQDECGGARRVRRKINHTATRPNAAATRATESAVSRSTEGDPSPRGPKTETPVMPPMTNTVAAAPDGVSCSRLVSRPVQASKDEKTIVKPAKGAIIESGVMP